MAKKNENISNTWNGAIVIDKKDRLYPMAKWLADAASKDPTRYFINGVWSRATDDGHILVSTDGNRMHIAYIKADASVDFPDGAIMKVKATAQCVIFEGAIEGQFPNYEGVIPKYDHINPFHLEMDKKDFHMNALFTLYTAGVKIKPAQLDSLSTVNNRWDAYLTGPTHPAVFTASFHGDPLSHLYQATAVIMPMTSFNKESAQFSERLYTQRVIRFDPVVIADPPKAAEPKADEADEADELDVFPDEPEAADETEAGRSPDESMNLDEPQAADESEAGIVERVIFTGSGKPRVEAAAETEAPPALSPLVELPAPPAAPKNWKQETQAEKKARRQEQINHHHNIKHLIAEYLANNPHDTLKLNMAMLNKHSPVVKYQSSVNLLTILFAGTIDARTFIGWKEAGRKVRKGAKALKILAPFSYTKTKDGGKDDDTLDDDEKTFFRLISVFRYEDTEPDGSNTPYIYEPLKDPSFFEKYINNFTGRAKAA
jgi:hypothetical protein